MYGCTVLCFRFFHIKGVLYTNNKHSTIIGNHNYAWGNIFHSECTYILVCCWWLKIVGHVHLIRLGLRFVQYHVQIEALWYNLHHSSLPHIFAWYNLHYLIATPDFWYDLHVLIATPDFFCAPDTPSGPHRKLGNLRRRYTSADTKSDELPPKIRNFKTQNP